MIHPAAIRKALPEDLEALVENILAMALESEGRELNRETLRAGIQSVFNRPELGTYWVVTGQAGEIMGNTLITVEWSDWNNAPYWWIQSLYLKQEYRGQGWFEVLLKQIESAAREENVAEIRLYVESNNDRAIKAYRKTGFEEGHYVLMSRTLN